VLIRILRLPLPVRIYCRSSLERSKSLFAVRRLHRHYYRPSGAPTAAPAAVGILTYRRRRARGSLGSELPGVRDGVCKLAAAAPLVALPNRAQKGDQDEDLLQSLALFFFAREGAGSRR
jgi:hypothetical protein